MRPLLLLALLAPTAGAYAVELHAPPVAGAGLPFLVEVCGEGEAPWQLRVAAENATLDHREDRYRPAEPPGRACRDVIVTPANGTVLLDARVRPEGGDPKARASANVTLLDLPWVACETAEVVDADGRIVLRAPLVEGLARLPALPGARLPAPASLRLVEARVDGVRVANDGPGPAILRAWGLANGTLEAGEEAFLEMTPPRTLLGATLPKLRAGEAWTPAGMVKLGRTDVPARWMDVEGEMLAYATPDSSHAPLVALVDAAREEVLVAAHTLTSADVAASLARAAGRGASVRVLLEGAPPGGVPPEERALVAMMRARGVEALAMGGEDARYRTMHAKLVVVDREATWVSTENLNDGFARGYAVVLWNATLARAVADVLDVDARGHDVAPLAADDRAEPAAGVWSDAPPARFPAATRRVALVLSPDDPRALAEAIARARESVDVAMLRAEAGSPMVDALVDAAANGARVRVLLDARFDDGTNAATAARLRERGVDARLDRADRTLHAKLVVIDGRVSYVGSMNWVEAALEKNREAGLLVEDEALAAYFTEAFERDRAGPALDEGREVPAPALVALVVIVLTARLLPRPLRASRRA